MKPLLIRGNALRLPLASGSIDCVVTSPPYFGLRDYGIPDQIGLESNVQTYIKNLVRAFREVRRVLTDRGTCWVVLGDSYARAAAKGLHKPGDLGKQDYIIRRGGGRASVQLSHLQSERQGSSDGKVGRGDRAAVRNGCDGLKPKDLIGIPWMFAFAARDDGWYLRADIVWQKPNPMPESVQDRPTRSHEFVFLLTKSERYDYDGGAIAEDRADQRTTSGNAARVRNVGGRRDGLTRPGGEPLGVTRNKRDVWLVAPQPFRGAHFATFPEALVTPCILAGCAKGGIVLDPFAGSGTVAVVAERLGRRSVSVDLTYHTLARQRLARARRKLSA